MYWPLKTPAVAKSEIPILNSYYIKACPTPSDPTMVWGTEVETSRLNDFLRQANTSSSVLVSGAHVLLRAVGQALVRHPRFNRRVLRRRLYRFRDVNLLMPFQKRREGEAELFLLKNADSRSVDEIAREMWQYYRRAARGEHAYGDQARLFRRIPSWLAHWALRLQLWCTNHLNRPVDSLNEQLRSASVLVNYLSHNGAAPMRSFKPSRFPSDCWTLNVTMGPTERRPVAIGENVVIRPVAPLFVRADHRVVDAYDLGKFIATLRTLLSDPRQMDGATPATDPATTRRVAVELDSNGHPAKSDRPYCLIPRQAYRDATRVSRTFSANTTDTSDPETPTNNRRRRAERPRR